MKAIEIIMLPVTDRAGAKEFYKRLGLEVLVEGHDTHGTPWIQMGFSQQSTTLSLSGFHAVVCKTDHIEKEVDLLRSRGIEVEKVDHTPYGKFAWLKDPDGNGICLREAPGRAQDS